ncbi:MAG: HNH endonuclease [Candidatus Nanopelagicales bacterium]|nr:HNH endonuclease [Candidatus Nanopelagicales bacterium]
MTLEHRAHWFTGRGELWLHAGTRAFLVDAHARARDVRRDEQAQEAHPVAYPVADGGRTYWRYRDRWYLDRDGLDAQEVQALLSMRDSLRAAAVSRARAQVGAAGSRAENISPRHIAASVRQFVWERDGGACVNCGATTELQFDHVIPLALGGGRDEDNLQILCGPCNRRKGVGVIVG